MKPDSAGASDGSATTTSTDGSHPGFTAHQAARLAHCTPAQLTAWRTSGLVVPSGSVDAPYIFRDLLALRVVRSLLDAGLSLVRIRRAIAEVESWGDDLATLRIVTDGNRVWACHDDGQILDALAQGQLALFVAVDRLAEGLDADVRAFRRERQSFVDGLRRRGDHPAGTG